MLEIYENTGFSRWHGNHASVRVGVAVEASSLRLKGGKFDPPVALFSRNVGKLSLASWVAKWNARFSWGECGNVTGARW